MQEQEHGKAVGPAATPLHEILAGLPGSVHFTRASPSWGAGLGIVAGPDAPHIDGTDAGPAVYLGRRTRNLLDAEFAPLSRVPGVWCRLAGVSVAGDGRLAVDASAGPVSLALPPVPADPAAELLGEGTSYVGVLYQLSAFLTGDGTVRLALRDTGHELAVERTVRVTGDGRRPCVALDGPLEPRTLEAVITVSDGRVALGGLMLEPYVTTHRTCDRAAQFPCPGAWVPGGQVRERDRLEVRVPAGAIPASGMIDFWFRPAWDALHPNHVFFEMAHWYFSFETGSQSPLLHAGEKPCAWMYYWEWGLGQGYAAHTWHHYAAVWDADGGTVTLYLDGQARACVQQVRTHALDPRRVGETLVIGGPVGRGMLADPNVAGELDGHLRTWRLTPGRVGAEDVLVAMVASDPCPRPAEPPARAVFLEDGPRAQLAIDEAHCWFAQWVQRRGADLVVPFSAFDDHHPGRHLRPQPGKRLARSRDGGHTWSVDRDASRFIPFASLPDGRRCWLTQRHAEAGHPFSLRLVDRTGREEAFPGVVENGDAPYCLCTLLALRGGGYLLFGYGNRVVSVLASADLRRWRKLAELRGDGQRVTDLSETAAVQFPNGRIMTVSRTGGWNEALVKCVSDDGGKTWTALAPTGLCGVFPTLQTTTDGTLFLSVGRPGIVLAVSQDYGETFATRVCAEDDRVHEFVDHFGWYGYSTMNNGLLVDEAARTAYLSYDLLGVRLPEDGTSRNACYVRHYPFRLFLDYGTRVTAFLPADAAAVRRVGRWQVVPGRLAMSTETGAALSGEFTSTGLVALLETSPYAGTALASIDDGSEVRLPLYAPQRLVQRRLLAADLSAGTHRFRLRLEAGVDHEHKFANPEMAALGGLQTVHLAGVTEARRLVVHGFEALDTARRQGH